MLMDLEYEDGKGRHTGTLSDISPQGCFILGSADAQDGDEVRVFLPLSAGMTVQFEGVIANHVVEIGFAVNFSEMSPVQAEFLESFIDLHQEALSKAQS